MMIMIKDEPQNTIQPDIFCWNDEGMQRGKCKILEIKVFHDFNKNVNKMLESAGGMMYNPCEGLFFFQYCLSERRYSLLRQPVSRAHAAVGI